MLVAHEDVVGTAGQSWSAPPHQLTEKDGYLYGRGTSDMLGTAAVELEAFLELARAKTRLRRDVILAMTGDEESGGAGIRYVLEHSPTSIDAGFVVTEGGKPELDKQGSVRLYKLEVAQKIYQDFELSAEGTTGHSSVPLADNAIYRLAQALARLSALRFPARLLPATRAAMAARAPLEKPEIGRAMKALAESKEGEPLPEDAVRALDAQPLLAPMLRTTCVATMLSGGTRVNALPARATANVNCRVLPDETLESVRSALANAIADPAVAIRPVDEFRPAPSAPVRGKDLETAEKVIERQWPGARVIPGMTYGASDLLYLRQRGVAAYGMDPLPRTEEDSRRAHGVDERIPAGALRAGVEFYHKLVLALAAK